ncbi:MAG: hypothetical protein MK186_06295 [Henriciella sp.]|nr:hypothetical protein [Henriciella sp.]
MRIKPLVALYLIAAALFLAFSGRAEGFGSPRILLGFLLPIAACHLVFARISSAYFAFRQNSKKVRSAFSHASSAGCFLIAFVASVPIDEIAISRTMERGDQILAKIEAYHDTNGSCPSAFTDLYPDPSDPPSPALFGSDFLLRNCGVWFNSTLFMTCERSIAEKDWRCSD